MMIELCVWQIHEVKNLQEVEIFGNNGGYVIGFSDLSTSSKMYDTKTIFVEEHYNVMMPLIVAT